MKDESKMRRSTYLMSGGPALFRVMDGCWVLKWADFQEVLGTDAEPLPGSP